MNIVSFKNNVEFGNGVKTKVLLETSFSKEICITLKSGQVMKEHKAPHPIVIHVLQGCIELTAHSETYVISGDEMITLEGNVPHSLAAQLDSVIRLTLSKPAIAV